MNKTTTRKAASAFPKKSAAVRTLERLTGGPLTFASLLASSRRREELSQADCAKRFGVSKSHLCDVEKGRKSVSPERAAEWARLLGYPETLFVCLAIQGALDAAGLRYTVAIQAA